jgi:hypothetical protein
MYDILVVYPQMKVPFWKSEALAFNGMFLLESAPWPSDYTPHSRVGEVAALERR